MHLSKFASFSKIRRPTSLDAKSNVDDSTPDSGSVPELGRTEVIGEVGGITKVVRRHPNLIGGSGFTASAMKKPRGGNEGNFVRLNINGYGKSKFKFRGNRKGYSAASGHRYFRGYRRKLTGAGGIVSKGACGEDGLAFEMAQVKLSPPFPVNWVGYIDYFHHFPF